MTKNQILQKLLKIHKKYSGERRSTKDSQMCTLWSTSNPPDILENTAPYDELVEIFDFQFSEEEAVDFYDMNISDAATYIFNILQNE